MAICLFLIITGFLLHLTFWSFKTLAILELIVILLDQIFRVVPTTQQDTEENNLIQGASMLTYYNTYYGQSLR